MELKDESQCKDVMCSAPECERLWVYIEVSDLPGPGTSRTGQDHIIETPLSSFRFQRNTVTNPA